MGIVVQTVDDLPRPQTLVPDPPPSYDASHSPDDGPDAGRSSCQNDSTTATSSGTGESRIQSGDVEVFTLTPAVMRSWLKTAVRSTLIVLIGYYTLCTLLLVSYRWVDPPTTGVQIQRAISAWWAGDAYERSYRPVSLADIDDDLELAVVSAEDTRFFQHTGIDWKAIGEAIEDNRERGRLHRGGSTITQQLAKNLFQTTHSSLIRKGLEVPLTYLTELVLPKERILELYLNVIEWGPGIFGAEAAAKHHYGRSASSLSRWHAAALAACIPNPHVRIPSRMTHYTRTILGRMRQVERFEAYF